MDDFPGNSRRQREEDSSPSRPAKTRAAGKNEKSKPARIVQGTATQRKKPLTKRVRETFTGSDSKGVWEYVKGVWEYVLLDVMVPAAKDTMADAMSQGMERLLFGEGRSRSHRPRSSSGGSSYTSYNRAYSNSGSPFRDTQYDADRGRAISSRGRSHHDFDEIIISSRSEAEQVIDNMFDRLSRYEVVTVSDLYDMVAITGNYTDEKWGWTELRGAGVQRIREGYLLDLPKPEPLER